MDITYLKHLWYISHGSIFLAKMRDMTISYLDITRELQCSKVCFANSCVISLTTIFCFACYPHGLVRVYRSILEILYFDKINIGPVAFHLIYLLNIQGIKLNVTILVKTHVDRAR